MGLLQKHLGAVQSVHTPVESRERHLRKHCERRNSVGRPYHPETTGSEEFLRDVLAARHLVATSSNAMRQQLRCQEGVWQVALAALEWRAPLARLLPGQTSPTFHEYSDKVVVVERLHCNCELHFAPLAVAAPAVGATSAAATAASAALSSSYGLVVRHFLGVQVYSFILGW